MSYRLTAQQVYAALRAAGASHQEAITLTAVSHGESGGFDIYAHNAKPPDNSFGLFQINMLGQMGKDRAKQWGLSSYEQLYDPRTNARAALSILRSQGLKAWTVYTSGAYKQYMTEAQAAGNAVGDNWQSVAQSLNKAMPNDGSGGSATSGDMGYVGGDAGAAGGVGSGGYNPNGGGLPPNATPDQIEDYIRETYPQAAGFLNIPELRTILINAARGEWTPEKLQGTLQASQWWRTHAEATRQYYALKATDPAQLKALIDQKAAEIQPELAALGIDRGQARAFAEEALKYGWTPDQIKAKFSKSLQVQSGKSGLQQMSEPDITADELMRMARNDYFVPISRQDAERWAIDIYGGKRTIDGLRDYFSRLSDSRFPGLTDGGFTPGEYMAPIRNIIAETLELNPADVDLMDRRWSAILEYNPGDGKTRPMTLAEATKWARSRPEYQYTNGAMDEASSFGETLAQTFRKVS